MLTNPKEIVPLQIARGALVDSPLPDVALPRSRGRVGVAARLCAALCAIENILDSLRAVGGPASRSVGGRLPRHLERAAQSFRKSTCAGRAGAHSRNDRGAAAGRHRLALERSARAAPRGMVDRDRLGGGRANLLYHALSPGSPP